MDKMKRLCEIIEEELHKIAEKGLNTGNLETAYKLIDMYKDIKNTEYWDQKSEYYMAVLDEMQGGYSENRDSMGRYSRNDGRMMQEYDNGSSYRGRRNGEHYVRGHYSRDGYSRDAGYSRNGGDYSQNYDRYMDSKASYRSSKTPECKQRLMESLEDYMDDFTRQMEEMARDSECQEEKETIMKYIRKLQNIR